jgi:hypothetical protein
MSYRILDTTRPVTTLNSLHSLNFAGGNIRSVVNSPNSSLLNVTSAASLECWYYRTSNSSIKQVIGQGDTGNSAFYLYGNGGSITSRIGNGSTFLGISATSNINTLYHVVLTYDLADAATARLYMNGVQVASGTLATGISLPADKSFSIGGLKSNTVTGRNMIGTIDNARFYNRALTPTEVTEHYNGVFNNNTGLLIHWSLDNVQGYGVHDSSGNNMHGTILDTTQVTVANRLVDF